MCWLGSCPNGKKRDRSTLALVIRTLYVYMQCIKAGFVPALSISFDAYLKPKTDAKSLLKSERYQCWKSICSNLHDVDI